MTAWTAQIRGDGSRWAAQVWRPVDSPPPGQRTIVRRDGEGAVVMGPAAEYPPPERLLKECAHSHQEQAEALQCARAMRVRLETAEAGKR